MRKTKIICTIGPACESEEMLSQMIDEGMNVARLNLSHGDYEEHGRRIERLHRLREEKGLALGIMLDTKGPEVRTGTFAEGRVQLAAGQTFMLTTRNVPGDNKAVSVSYSGLPSDLNVGSHVLIDDGLVELCVRSIENGTDIVCEILNGGELSGHKGINLPGAHLRIPSVTQKDIDDIRFGIEKGVDIVAASFVRSASDIMQIRDLLAKNGGAGIHVFAKIETAEGVGAIEDIIKVVDGVMVARGDLGVEIPAEDLPAVQKRIVRMCNAAGKPVITATQMLDSMIRNPRPTRAEVNDVANSILDGSDNVMLSGETASGRYPLEALRMMNRIAERVERDGIRSNVKGAERDYSVTNAVSYACHAIAQELNAAAIITPTQLGSTARRVSKFRPHCPLVATTSNRQAYHQLSTSWGVVPVLVEMESDTDGIISHSIDKAREMGILKDGDVAVISAGVPVGISGTTNMIHVHVVGDVLLRGKGVGDARATGAVCVVNSEKDAREKFRDGDILVCSMTDNALLPYMKRAAGVIAEVGDYMSHAAVVGLALELPVILDAQNARGMLRDQMIVTLDPHSGLVYNGEVRGV